MLNQFGRFKMMNESADAVRRFHVDVEWGLGGLSNGANFGSGKVRGHTYSVGSKALE